jgi:hypothetical protein
MLTRLIATRVIARAVLVTVLSSLIVSIPIEIAWAAKKLPPGACITQHRRVVINGGACQTNCNSANWCVNMACFNGSLAQLPLPCHSPEACPAVRC